MELTLLRKFLGQEYTIGNLSHGDKFLCNTLEDKVRDLSDYNHDGDFDDKDEGKVYGKTAIPAGRYKVKVVYSMKFKRMLPKLLSVPGFVGILIHAGNDETNTEGCILVGENRERGKVLNSRYHEAVITKMIQDAINNKEEVFLTIKQ